MNSMIQALLWRVLEYVLQALLKHLQDKDGDGVPDSQQERADRVYDLTCELQNTLDGDDA